MGSRRLIDTPSPNRGSSLRTKPVEARSAGQLDLTDLMNDVFFGTTPADVNKSYNLSGADQRLLIRNRDEDEFESSSRSFSSRQTQEWLERAKQMVASSPSRVADQSHSPRLAGSPRFGVSPGRLSTSTLDKRDPLSRSARRHRAIEGFSGEILTNTAKHTRNISDTKLADSPAPDIQKWFSNILKLPTENAETSESAPPSPTSPHGGPPLRPRQSMIRKSRFQTDPTTPPPPTTANYSQRQFKTPTVSSTNQPSSQVQSSPPLRNPLQSPKPSSALSPPRNLVESVHRRSITSSTCRSDRTTFKAEGEAKGQDLNSFLKEQRSKIEKISSGELNGITKIVLSGNSNSTSSMVAAICYAWLLQNRKWDSDKKAVGNRRGGDLEVVVPVMNIRRGRMWKQRQAAWLFHHVNLDASALLFSNEMEFESLMMSKKLSMLVVGEDILRTTKEVGSACTILTDNYCEHAYELLQTPILKKLLLAGILLDTENLNASCKLSTTKDAEAVQLITAGSSPSYQNMFYNQLMEDERDDSFFEILNQIYGKSPSDQNGREREGTKTSARSYRNEVSENKHEKETRDAKPKRISPNQGKVTPPRIQLSEPPRGRNKNFFAKLFGFGQK